VFPYVCLFHSQSCSTFARGELRPLCAYAYIRPDHGSPRHHTGTDQSNDREALRVSCFPFYAFSDARVSPARPRIARLHMQCVRDEINEIIHRSPREGCPTRRTPWDSFQEASLVVHTLEVHASSAYRGCQRCDETSERPTHHTLYVGGPSPYETSYY